MAEHIRASVSLALASRHVLNQYRLPGFFFLFCTAGNEVGKVILVKLTAVNKRAPGTSHQQGMESSKLHFISLQVAFSPRRDKSKLIPAIQSTIFHSVLPAFTNILVLSHKTNHSKT